MGSAARVIDLDSVRAKRFPQKRMPAPQAPSEVPLAGPMVWMPVVIWVPCWQVG
jgi:hypothetical protein